MEIKQIDHINKSTIKKHNLSAEETQKLVSKFYHTSDGALFSENSSSTKPEWQAPVGEIERDFALDMIIH